jgi:hypothetical protein
MSVRRSDSSNNASSYSRANSNNPNYVSTGDPDLDEALADTSSNEGKSNNNVTVICRVRPFNRREIELQGEMNAQYPNEWERKPLRSVVEMEGGDTVFLDHQNNYAERQRFPFDISFWSVPPDQQQTGKNPVAEQVDVYKQVGIPIIKNVWAGFNSCIFAYGQTGSGKTFSMMGAEREDLKGLIPRVCEGLFNSIDARRKADALEENNSPGGSAMQKEYKLEARFFEIYNEKVKDLLWALRTPTEEDANIDKENIRVRHLGSEISLVGLTCVQVDNAEDCLRLIEEGTRNRSTGATKMNDQSSRSHSIFRLTFIQTTRVIPKDKFEKPKVYNRTSTVSLVDLAGSERMKKTGAEGQRLKEAVAINQSLTTLKNVIDALVEGRSVIPYRDSTLTWILSDNLGGNSKTWMIACVSPHLDNADETLNTLRYALRTQAIVNHATVNESDELKKMNKMKEELERLQQQYADGAGDSEFVNLKSRQAELSQQASRTKDQADDAVKTEAKTRQELEIARRRRYNIAYRGAFHRVFQKRVDLAYTAYFARDAATLAGLKREVESFKHDSSITDKELSELRAEERRTASALKNSEAELSRQRDRNENTQAALRELDKSEARNMEEIQLRQAKIPQSDRVSKQIIQRKLLGISVERERLIRVNTSILDKIREQNESELENLRQEREKHLDPLRTREREILEMMQQDDQDHKHNMESLKQRLQQLQSSCVFVENENKRSANEVDEAILQGNKDRFETFAASEAESKKKLQEFQVQSKASLAAELETMRLNLSEGQTKHDRQIDRLLEKARDDVIRLNRESEVRANAYQEELKSRLHRYESLNADAGSSLRSSKAAQKRYSDLFVHILHVLSGASPPELNTAEEMESIEEVIKRLQQAMGLASFDKSSKQLQHQQVHSPTHHHQSHTPLAFRTGTSHKNAGDNTTISGKAGHSRSSSQALSHSPSMSSNTPGHQRSQQTPRNVRFADPKNLRGVSAGGESTTTPSKQLVNSPSMTETPKVLLRKAPPVYQTATSKLRAAYADLDRKLSKAYIEEEKKTEKPFSPRIYSTPEREEINNKINEKINSSRRGASANRSPGGVAATPRSPAGVTHNNNNNSSARGRSPGSNHDASKPWNNYENYYGYKSLSSNEEVVVYSQRVVIEGSVIAMRTHSGPGVANASPNKISPKRGLSPNSSARRGTPTATSRSQPRTPRRN